jgi:hypothetical protein
MIRLDDPGIIDDIDFVLKALDRNGKALTYVSQRLQNDPLVLSYAKYSDQPLVLTPAQNAIVIPFLQEKKNALDSFKKTMVTSRLSQTNGLSGLTRHGPHFYKQFLGRMYSMNGLNEEIVFILNKMNYEPDTAIDQTPLFAVGGISKTKKRKIKKRKTKK